MIQIKRAYEAPTEQDGYRVLVDRIWPRGKSKESEKLDEWLKEVAPSTELRKWFNHEANKYPEFKQKYQEELKHEPTATAFKQLQTIVKNQPVVTLVYGAKDTVHNQAVVLKELLEKELLTESEIAEVEEHEEIVEFVNNGHSSNKYASSTTWFTVKTADDEEFDIYCKY